jgi:hypothetical protein
MNSFFYCVKQFPFIWKVKLLINIRKFYLPVREQAEMVYRNHILFLWEPQALENIFLIFLQIVQNQHHNLQVPHEL